MNRFRKWLIKKLGGYTEFRESRIVDLVHQELKPVEISFSATRPPESAMPTADPAYIKMLEEYELHGLAERVSDMIIKDRLFDVCVEPPYISSYPGVKRLYIVRVLQPRKDDGNVQMRN